MKTTKFRYIESILRMYPNLDKVIRSRKEELMYPYRPPDSNTSIKVLFSNNNVESNIIKVIDDKEITLLERKKEAVEYALNNSCELTKRVIELYYFDRRKLSWRDISLRLYTEYEEASEATLKRKRRKFFEHIAFFLNLKN